MSRQTKNALIRCAKIEDAAVADTINDGKVVKYVTGAAGEATVGLATDGSVPVAGVVYAKDCPEFYKACDQVDIQTTGDALVCAGAALVAGDALVADADGNVVPGTGFIVGYAPIDAVAGQKIQIHLNLISV